MQAATIGSTVVIGALALSTGPDVVQVVATEPATTIQLVLPIDVVELVKAIFTGLAAVASAFAAVYAVVGAARAKRAEAASVRAETVSMAADTKIETVSKQIDGLLTARDAAKVKEGEATATVAAGVSAEAMRLGIEQGIRQERESVAAANPASTAAIAPAETPVSVTDEASIRVADATEKLAAAAEKTAEKS